MHARRCTPSGHHTRAHGALRTPTRKTHRLPTCRCAQTDDDVATRHTRPCVMIVRRPWLLMVAWLYSSLAIPIDKPAELPALEGPSEFQVAGRWVALLPAHGCTTAGVWQDLDHVCLTAPAASRECRLLVEGEGWLAESPHGAATAGAETAHVHAGAAAAVLPCKPLRKTPLHATLRTARASHRGRRCHRIPTVHTNARAHDAYAIPRQYVPSPCTPTAPRRKTPPAFEPPLLFERCGALG